MLCSRQDSSDKNTNLQNIVKNYKERKNRNSYESKSHSKRIIAKKKIINQNKKKIKQIKKISTKIKIIKKDNTKNQPI